MKVIFHVVLRTGEEYHDIQEIAGVEHGHSRIYFIKKYPATADDRGYKGYVVEGRIGNQTLYYDNHLFSLKSKPERIGRLIGYVVLRPEPEPRANILDRITELEKGMLIKTKEIAILKARVDELRPPPPGCAGMRAMCVVSNAQHGQWRPKILKQNVNMRYGRTMRNDPPQKNH